MCKKILIKEYTEHANLWIYNGFATGWKELGYEVVRWTNLSDHDPQDDHLMITSFDISVNKNNEDELISFLSKFSRIYMFVAANFFPNPYGQHPNFVDNVAKNHGLVEKLKNLDNIVFWTFCDISKSPQFWEKWGKVHYVPLAFDHVNYERVYDPKFEFDVCYVGGWANNGFNTKKQILKEYLGAFKDSDLKCGFFINKDLTHEQECKILTNSLVCLNIHDEYQRKLQLDTNERTWKSVGLNGILVSDYVGDVIPDYVYQCTTSEEMVTKVKELVEDFPLVQKERNSSDVQKHHTYLERCKQLEKL